MRCPVVVGRRSEIEAVDRALTAARSGRGSMLALAGEPGIGKSRLLAEARRLASTRDFVAMSGRAIDEAASAPLRAWADALVGHFGDRVAPTTAELHGFVNVLATVIPGWRDERWHAAPDHELMFGEAVRRLLMAEASADPSRPILVTLDDLHWSDPATLSALRHLRDHLEGIASLSS